ncbi:MAG: hypothetical protein JOY95_10905 [Silvibacterium sp.]|nr:hypothetical protein [Silvibacterium sp.]
MRQYSPRIFTFFARLVAIVLPQRLWYPAIFRLSRLQALILRVAIVISPYRTDRRRPILVSWLMNSWLQALSTLERPFPIPIRVRGHDAIIRASANPNGMAICSVHLPLKHMGLRPLADLNRSPDAVITAQRELVNGKFPVWGLGQGLPPLNSDRHVLLKVRTILRRGGSIAALIDNGRGELFPHKLFHLIRSVKAQVVFVLAQLQPNGEILVEYFTPPDPFCKTDDSISSNLLVLKARIDRVLQASPDNQLIFDPAEQTNS